MKCPVDGETLAMTERSGVEIDYCPTCRGVWLDRGELDKLLDRADEREKSSSPATRPDNPKRDRDDQRTARPKRRESWWSDILDF